MKRTNAQIANQQMRQDSLRELLSKQKHVEQVIVLAEKIESIGEVLEGGKKETEPGKFEPLDGLDVQRLTVSIKAKKDVIDTKLKLINKYLGDMKTVEHTGEVTQNVVSDRNQLEELLIQKGIDPSSISLH